MVCVFADAPLKEGVSAGVAYGARRPQYKGFPAMQIAVGYGGANPRYAMAARRHMQKYGTTSEQFGAVAVQQRQWATMNPMAQFRDPITLEDHQSSRWIADPLRLLDCCLVSNGGIAVIVTSAERAKSLRQPPVYVHGFRSGPPGPRSGTGMRFW